MGLLACAVCAGRSLVAWVVESLPCMRCHASQVEGIGRRHDGGAFLQGAGGAAEHVFASKLEGGCAMVYTCKWLGANLCLSQHQLPPNLLIQPPLAVLCACLPPQYYDLPSVSLRAAAWRNMRDGVDGFRVRGGCTALHWRAAVQPSHTWQSTPCLRARESSPQLAAHVGPPASNGHCRRACRLPRRWIASSPGAIATRSLGRRSLGRSRALKPSTCTTTREIFFITSLNVVAGSSFAAPSCLLPRRPLPGASHCNPPSLSCAAPQPSHPAVPCSIHPGPSGHQVLAELLAGLITKAAQEVAASATSAPAPRPGQEGLPPPMVKNFRDSRTSVCAQLVGAHRLPMCLSAKCMLPVGMSSARLFACLAFLGLRLSAVCTSTSMPSAARLPACGGATRRL